MKVGSRSYVIKMLEFKIEDLDSLLLHDKNETILRKRKECKIELDNLYQKRAAEYQVRSRARWIELVNKNKNCSLFGIRWPKVIRCLGIYLAHNKSLNEKLNWT